MRETGPRGSDAVRFGPRRGCVVSMVRGGMGVPTGAAPTPAPAPLAPLASCCRASISLVKDLPRSNAGGLLALMLDEDRRRGCSSGTGPNPAPGPRPSNVALALARSRSFSLSSGGGVGGNSERLIGGSECWRPPVGRGRCLTRWEAAQEMLSRGRSSMPRAADRVLGLWSTALPVPSVLPELPLNMPGAPLRRSEVAMRRAFPKYSLALRFLTLASLGR